MNVRGTNRAIDKCGASRVPALPVPTAAGSSHLAGAGECMPLWKAWGHRKVRGYQEFR